MTVMSMVLSAASNSSNVNPPTPAPDFVTWKNSFPPTPNYSTVTIDSGGIAVDSSGNIVVAGNNAAGDSDILSYGPNSTTKNWTNTTVTAPLSRGAWGNSVYVFVNLGGGTFSTTGIRTSSDGSTWTLRQSGNLAVAFQNISFTNSLFFLMASSVLRSSSDGVTWTTRNNPGATVWESIVKTSTNYVLVGATGTIRTSTDLATWTTRTSGVSWNIKSVTTKSGVTVAVGDGEGIIRSTDDGVTWSSVTYTGSGTNYIDVATDGTNFVLLGYAASSTLVVRTSSDGSSWTTRGLPFSNCVSAAQLTYQNGTFYLLCNISVVGTPSTPRVVLTSTDSGLTWNVYSSGIQSYGVFYIPDTSTFINTTVAGVLYTSTNSGATWTTRKSVASTPIAVWSVAYGAGLYVTVGAGSSIRTSPDLVTWTSRTGAPTTTMNSIIYGGSRFVSVGSDYSMTSTDGITWSSTNVGASSGLHGVTYGNSIYVAVGAGVWTSSNGSTWTQRTVTGTPTFRGVCWTGSLFVAVGVSGVIHTSSDGITWTSRTSGVTTQLWDVAYIGSTIVAVGAGSRILTSTDGITWTARTSLDTTKDFFGVAGNSAAAIVSGTYGYIVINP